MGWLNDFLSRLEFIGPGGLDRLARKRNYDLNLRRQAMLEDEAYDQRRRTEQMFPLQVEGARLRNQSITSMLEDAMRERSERAQAPGAAQAVVEAFMPKAARTEMPPEEDPTGGFGGGYTPARPAARTAGDLFSRGITPEQFDLAERYRPATIQGLGLMTPEAAEKAGQESAQRRRSAEIQQEAEGLDFSAPDAKDKAYQIAARLAAVKGDAKGLIAAITRSEDPAEIIKRIQEGMGAAAPGGLGERQRVQVKAGDLTFTFEPDNPTHVIAKRAVEEKGWRPGMPGYWQEVFSAIKQLTVPPGGAVQGAGDLIKPPAAGAGATASASGTTPAPGTTSPGGPTPRYERPVSADTLTDYVDKETLQHPPAGWTQAQIEKSGRYVAVAKGQLPAIRQLVTMKTMLETMEDIVERRPDLFPRSTGNGPRDAVNIALAKAKWAGGSISGDADIAQINTLIGTLPMTVKAFGDTGNIAVKEREIAQTAFGLSPNTAEAARTKIATIRDLINGSTRAGGFPELKPKTIVPSAKMPAKEPGPETPGVDQFSRALKLVPSGKTWNDLDEETKRRIYQEAGR